VQALAPVPVALDVEGPQLQPVQPVLEHPNRFGVLYEVTARTPDRPDERFRWGQDFTEHEDKDCRCREHVERNLERCLAANIEYLPSSGIYIARWRFCPGSLRHHLGTGSTVQQTLAHLAAQAGKDQKEVVH